MVSTSLSLQSTFNDVSGRTHRDPGHRSEGTTQASIVPQEHNCRSPGVCCGINAPSVAIEKVLA